VSSDDNEEAERHSAPEPGDNSGSEWLARRMKNLRRMPPPTLKEVAAHLKASAEIRKRLSAKQPA